MPQTVKDFGAKCHDLLKTHPGPAGREQVCAALRELLKDESFVNQHLTDSTGERDLLYEDPELGFCVFAHHYRGAKTSPPHDHGPSWAIYGQAKGETEMSDYQLLEPATEETPGKVKKVRTYKLTPGVAHLYNEGDLHSPTRTASTHLIRIEGINMEKVRRMKYKEAA